MLGAQGERVRRPEMKAATNGGLFSRRLWRGWLFSHVRGQFLGEKLLKNGAGSAASDTDERVFESQGNAIPVGSRIVKVREASSGEAAENVRVIGLPASVIAPAND